MGVALAEDRVVWREVDGALTPFLGGTQIAWAPQPGSQVVFLSCPTYEALYEGTRGPGKTVALIIDFGKDCDRGWGARWRGILFRRTYPELQDVIDKSKEIIPVVWPHARFNEAKSFWEWPNGEKLHFRQFDKPRDYWKYHGHEYPWIGWEELTNWSDDNGYKKMMSCNRTSHPEIAPRIRSTTNPYGVGHNWVKHRFRLPIAPGDIAGPVINDSVDFEGNLERPRRAIHGYLDENKVLMHAEPDYKDTLRTAATSEAELKAWLHGSWDIVAGGMFDDLWDPRVHVVESFPIPAGWRIDRSFDWGSSKPFSVGWWAESDGSDVLTEKGWMSTVRGDLFRIHEWYGWTGKPNQGTKMLATDISRGIIEREMNWGIADRVKPGPADSSIYKAENGNCIATDMEKKVRANGQLRSGTYWIRADKSPGSRVTGWETVRKMLKQAKPEENGHGTPLPRENPGLFVFKTCGQFLRTVPVLPRDEKKPDDVYTDAEDHVADEVRYRVRTIGTRPRQGRHVGMY